MTGEVTSVCATSSELIRITVGGRCGASVVAGSCTACAGGAPGGALVTCAGAAAAGGLACSNSDVAANPTLNGVDVCAHVKPER